MDPTEDQRRELAHRIRSERIARFGTQKAAYVAAGVNATTWAKAEDGDLLAERTLIAILKLLWPESGGDWQHLNPPLVEADLEHLIQEGPWSEKNKDYMLRLVRQDRERMEASETA